MMLSTNTFGPMRCYKLLFEAGAAETINTQHLSYKHTALQLCIGNLEYNQDEIIQMFLDNGADTSNLTD